MSKVGEACNNCNKRHAGCHDTCLTYFAKQMAEGVRQDRIRKASLPDRQQHAFFCNKY